MYFNFATANYFWQMKPVNRFQFSIECYQVVRCKIRNDKVFVGLEQGKLIHWFRATESNSYGKFKDYTGKERTVEFKIIRHSNPYVMDLEDSFKD
jgi:hypothetical protein